MFINFKCLFLASEVLSEATKIQNKIEKSFSSFSKGAQKVCVLLLKQNVSLANCILLLCRRKYLGEARILTRSLLETSAYLLFISEKDHEERSELYRHSLALSHKVAVDEFNDAVPEGCKKIDTRFYDESEGEALKYFRRKHGQDAKKDDIKKKYTLDPRKAANQLSGEIKKVYDTLYTKFYRAASALSHGQDPISSFKFMDKTFEKKKEYQKHINVELRMVIQTVCILILYDLEYIDAFLKLNYKDRLKVAKRNVENVIELIKKS